MSRHSIYLSEADDKFLEKEKERFGSASKVIQVSLNKLREDEMKEYYLQKNESYSELRKAQEEVIKRQEEKA